VAHGGTCQVASAEETYKIQQLSESANWAKKFRPAFSLFHVFADRLGVAAGGDFLLLGNLLRVPYPGHIGALLPQPPVRLPPPIVRRLRILLAGCTLCIAPIRERYLTLTGHSRSRRWQNVDIRVIEVLLGHAKLETTALYTRVAVNTIRDVTSPLQRLGLNQTAPFPTRGFLLTRLSDAGPASSPARLQRAGVRNPSAQRSSTAPHEC
jgi:hypothetical protein